MRVLLTGAAGFIGSHVCEVLVARGIEVKAVDFFLDDLYPAAIKRANWDSLRELTGVELIEFDLREELPDSLFAGIDVVLNQAAMPGLMKSWTYFSLYAACNLGIVENLARGCVKNEVPHFIQISTSSVYGSDAMGDESAELLPVSPYGVTKLAAEELLRTYQRVFDLDYTILRYFSVYGPRQRPDMAYHKFIKAILTSQVIDIYGDGMQTRTNTYVLDCASATVEAVLRLPKGATINIAGNEEVSLLEALSQIEDALGLRAKIRFHSARPGDQRHTKGEIKLAGSLLGYEPQTNLKLGLLAQSKWQSSIQ